MHARLPVSHRIPIAQYFAILTVLLSAFFICGCQEAAPPPTADLSTPKSTALFYLKAVQRGDARTARTVCIGTPEQKQWVDGLATMIGGMRSFNEALYTKFGRIVLQVHVDLEEQIRVLADEPVGLVEIGNVSENEQKALITLPRRGFTSHFQLPIYLSRVPTGWRIDLAQTYATDLPANKFGDVTQRYSQMRRFGEAFQATAREVLAGHYPSVDAAQDGLAARLRPEFQAK